MLGLIPSGCAGLKSSSTTLPLISAYHFEAQKASGAPSQAAEFDCLKLRGLKQAGGFLTEDPLASSPYPKALLVSTSEESQPSRCGTLRLARLKHWINRALATSSTFVLAIRNITERFPQMQGFFLPSIKNFAAPFSARLSPILSTRRCVDGKLRSEPVL